MSCLKPSWYRLLFSVTFLPHNHCDLWGGQHGRSIVLICIDRHKKASPLYTTLLVHMLPLKYKYTNTKTKTTYFLWTDQLFLPTVVFMYQKVTHQIIEYKKGDHSNNFNIPEIWPKCLCHFLSLTRPIFWKTMVTSTSFWANFAF